MKKKLIFAAAAIAMLASCSQNDLEAPVVGQTQQSNAVEFGTYLGKAATSRAGWSGSIDDDELKESSKANGFGVFGFYTQGDDYPNSTSGNVKPTSALATNSLTPNFMYNQHVSWDGSSKWTYSPLKYWPNEIAGGAVDAQTPPAQGAAVNGKVSFFAYAPYVSSAGGTEGITAMKANNVEGNPTVTYTMSTKGDDVDLLWGTFSTNTSSVVGTDDLTGGYVWGYDGTDEVANIGNVSKTPGSEQKTNVNMFKQKNNQNVTFDFKHALAKVGGVGGIDIKLNPDEGTGFGTTNPTVVTVNSITISKDASATKNQTGVFDLATGIWSNLGTDYTFSQTIKETSGDATINPDIQEQSVNTTVDAVANTAWSTSTDGMLNGTHKGVTLDAQSVYKNDQKASLMYFPGETPVIDVNIIYTVRTKDPSLASGYSEVVQNITKKITMAAVTRGKWYKLHIILGLESVKFEATVADWTNTPATDDTEVNLPLNVN